MTAFDDFYGINASHSNDLTNNTIDIVSPVKPDCSTIYQKMKEFCNDPASITQVFNARLLNHSTRKVPLIYNAYQQSKLTTPLLNLLPYVLNEKIVFAMANHSLVMVKDFLSPWQYFAFRSFNSYFNTLLACKIYNGEPRKWLMTTMYSMLLENKTVFNKIMISQIKLKDKIHKNNTYIGIFTENKNFLSIYSLSGVLTASGGLTYQPIILKEQHSNKEPTNGAMNKSILLDKETNSEAQVVLLNWSDGKTNDQDLKKLIKSTPPILHLINACEIITKSNNKSFTTLEIVHTIAKMIIGYDCEFIHSFYYLASINQNIFDSLLTISSFIHRKNFLIKTLSWAIIDNSHNANDIFSTIFAPHYYLIQFIQQETTTVISRISVAINEYCARYIINEDGLKDDNLIIGLVQTFWKLMMHNFMAFPKSVFNTCRHLFVCTYKKFGNSQNPYNGVTTLMFNKVIIPTLLNFTQSGITRKAIVKLSSSISTTASMHQQNQDKFSLYGKESLLFFLTKIIGETRGNKEKTQSSMNEFVKSTEELIHFIKENGKILYTILYSSSENNDHKNKIPDNILPWSIRLSEEIFYSYFIQGDDKQT
ncbi:hypothetical protein TRFO_26588 [Tritrichomonas foetus]|uniref:Uncharacterized protein n=1 Tax=Tritrichomonas foetus TaxID=1144522 RepID=A0A1J4K829_9EUKA|nr:hypothetical protein TRFO_26588 [Tritrichomonas foetus]|eukprot:OHT05589.1 hypothetical protein TRFO_26588 [Tritrichomonas foetus]